MPLDKYVQVLKETGKHLDHVHLFLNNDPLFENRLPQFTALTKKYTKAKTVIYTNGTNYNTRHLLTDKNLDKVHFTISAATPETYLQVHRKPLYHQAIKTYNWFLKHKRNNQQVYVHFVITPQNIEELPQWRRLFVNAQQIVSSLHDGYMQYASKELLKTVDIKSLIDKSTFKGEVNNKFPCSCWNNLSISSRGEYLQCCTSPYHVNYGKIGEIHTLDAWAKRNRNMMENPTCQQCMLKQREWKAILQKHLS